MIKLKDKKIVDLITGKDKAIDEGIAVSTELARIEKEIISYENKEKDITSKVNVGELKERGERLNKECQEKFDELQKVIKQIEILRLSHIPVDMKEAHTALMKKREALERERNKLALKVQKFKDKLIPMIQKAVKPLLKEFDDIETAKVKDGEVIITSFNHLEDFKRKFKR